jgi:hypothetical protein
MAASIAPLGAELRVMPQVPTLANDIASLPGRMQAAASSGALFTEQLLNLQNTQANKELEAMQIKAKKAQNDLDLALTQHAIEKLPEVQAHVDTLLKTQAAADTEALAAATQRAGVGAVLGGTELAAANTAAANAREEAARAAARAGAGAIAGGAELAGAKTAAVNAETARTRALAAQRETGNLGPIAEAGAVANAGALGQAYGGIGLPLPNTPAPAAAPITGPATVFDNLNTNLLGQPLPAAPTEVLPTVQADVNAPAGSIPALKHFAVTGQPTRGSTGNPILDATIAKMTIPMELARTQALQTETRKLLDEYVVPNDVRRALQTSDGVYDVSKVQKYIDSIKNDNPKVTYGKLPGFTEHFDKAAEIKLTQQFSRDTLPTLLKSLNDPSAFQNTLNSLRNSDPAKGFFTKVLSNAAAKGTDEKTAIRAALIDYVDNRYQTIFNNHDVGRNLRNAVLVSPKDSNATVLAAVKTMDGLLDFEFNRETSGYPVEAFDTLKDGSAFRPMTPGQLVQERNSKIPSGAARAPVTSTKSVTAPSSDVYRYNGVPGRFQVIGGTEYWVPGK